MRSLKGRDRSRRREFQGLKDECIVGCSRCRDIVRPEAMLRKQRSRNKGTLYIVGGYILLELSDSKAPHEYKTIKFEDGAIRRSEAARAADSAF
ncbi:hypothetical protein NDU88_005535 [Pleurodeles waltl]|uniref:Uncharacterized protein n=1 Tax=Pleurodeles waltl TaxID=8319 RepID=A0AAV7L2T6_PLEWA|nr:hypothetical protein NDU88_005535 [Pleurodeles waltl]